MGREQGRVGLWHGILGVPLCQDFVESGSISAAVPNQLFQTGGWLPGGECFDWGGAERAGGTWDLSCLQILVRVLSESAPVPRAPLSTL